MTNFSQASPAGPHFVGQDFAGMEELERLLLSGADRLAEVNRETFSVVSILESIWRGQVMVAFSQLWRMRHSIDLRQAEMSLRSAAETVRRNADQQRLTSGTLERGDRQFLYLPAPRSGPDVDLSDPTPANGDGHRFHRPDSESHGLFGRPGEEREPRLDDIAQGSLGDCWALTGLGAVAHSNPEAIADAITDNGDGTYTVRLYEFVNGERVVHHVRVDGEVPMRGRLLLGDAHAYAQPGENGATYPLIFEKALAELHGGSYENIEGGSSQLAMEAILGVDVTRGDPASMSDGELVDALRSGPVGIGMLNPPQDRFDGSAFDSLDLFDSHQYVVQDVRNVNGEWVIDLYNPHGPGGERTVTLDELRSVSDEINFVR